MENIPFDPLRRVALNVGHFQDFFQGKFSWQDFTPILVYTKNVCFVDQIFFQKELLWFFEVMKLDWCFGATVLALLDVVEVL